MKCKMSVRNKKGWSPHRQKLPSPTESTAPGTPRRGVAPRILWICEITPYVLLLLCCCSVVVGGAALGMCELTNQSKQGSKWQQLKQDSLTKLTCFLSIKARKHTPAVSQNNILTSWSIEAIVLEPALIRLIVSGWYRWLPSTMLLQNKARTHFMASCMKNCCRIWFNFQASVLSKKF